MDDGADSEAQPMSLTHTQVEKIVAAIRLILLLAVFLTLAIIGNTSV